MKTSIVPVSLFIALSIVMVGCVGADDADLTQEITTADEPVASVEARPPVVAERSQISETAGRASVTATADRSSVIDVTETPDSDLADSIEAPSMRGESVTNSVSCTGWANGGYLCLATCAGMSGWQYTNYAYPSIQYGQCDAKGDKFCADHWSYRTGSCWGTW